MDREPSGPDWVGRFPDAGTTAALDPAFRPGCEAFIAAMKEAGISVEVASTRRPVERAYLMHYCWRIFKQTLNSQNVPAKAGVDIEWMHRDAGGAVDLAASRKAAAAMVRRYGIAFQPSLTSRHVEGKAIDMTIRWRGNVTLVDGQGARRAIASSFNQDLRRVGRSYGTVKHPSDAPHWSTDGR